MFLVSRYGDELTSVITQTVNRWDGREAARRIELHVGRDLQFIRINGTIVGGLVGVVIHAASLYLLTLTRRSSCAWRAADRRLVLRHRWGRDRRTKRLGVRLIAECTAPHRPRADDHGVTSTRDVADPRGLIRLGQFLKLADLVDTGADAKELLAGRRRDGERRGRVPRAGRQAGAR